MKCGLEDQGLLRVHTGDRGVHGVFTLDPTGVKVYCLSETITSPVLFFFTGLEDKIEPSDWGKGHISTIILVQKLKTTLGGSSMSALDQAVRPTLTEFYTEDDCPETTGLRQKQKSGHRPGQAASPGS